MNLENKNEEQIVAELLESIFGFKPEVKKAEYKTSEQINKDLKEAASKLKTKQDSMREDSANRYIHPDIFNQQVKDLQSSGMKTERRISDNIGQKDQKASARYKVVFKDRNSSPIIISEGLHIELGKTVGKSNISNFRDTLVHVEHEGEYLTVNTSDILNIQKV